MKSILSRMVIASGLVSGVFLLSGCDPIEGSLDVTKPFAAITEKKTNCHEEVDPRCRNKDNKITIPAGVYDLSFDFRTKREAAMTLKVNKKNVTLLINVPQGKNVPENGAINLSSKESGQPFDMYAQVSTVQTRSRPYANSESCTVQYQEQVCRTVGNPPRTECYVETRTRYGTRHSEYYYLYTDKSLHANFSEIGNKESAFAQFNGTRRDKETVYTYQSPCY